MAYFWFGISSFPMAPRFLFRLLLMLLSGSCLGSVCELDAAECRQNYANESHESPECIMARQGVDVLAPAAQPDDVPAAWPLHWTGPAPRPTFRDQPGSPASWPWGANPPPPMRRLYLHYAVLQV